MPPHDRRECTGILARHVIAQQALVRRFTLAAWAGNVLHGTFNVRETSPSIALTAHWFYAHEGGEGLALRLALAHLIPWLSWHSSQVEITFSSAGSRRL